METRAAVADLDAGDPLSPPADIDENGFPCLLFPSLSDEEVAGEGEEEAAATDGELPSAASGFAADFYASGTDWSCLVEVDGRGEGGGGARKKTLVQRNLFQMWGIGNPSPSPGASGSRALVPPPTKRRRRAVEDGVLVGEGDPISGRRGCDEQGKERRRACPFYKKIPGDYSVVPVFHAVPCLNHYYCHCRSVTTFYRRF